MKNNFSQTGSLWDLSKKTETQPEEDNLVQNGWQSVANLSTIFGQATEFAVGAPLILQALAPFDFAASTLWLLERNTQLRCIATHGSRSCLIDEGQKVLPVTADHIPPVYFAAAAWNRKNRWSLFP